MTTFPDIPLIVSIVIYCSRLDPAECRSLSKQTHANLYTDLCSHGYWFSFPWQHLLQPVHQWLIFCLDEELGDRKLKQKRDRLTRNLTAMYTSSVLIYNLVRQIYGIQQLMLFFYYNSAFFPLPQFTMFTMKQGSFVSEVSVWVRNHCAVSQSCNSNLNAQT